MNHPASGRADDPWSAVASAALRRPPILHTPYSIRKTPNCSSEPLINSASQLPALVPSSPRILVSCPLAAPPRSPLHFCTRLRRSCTFALSLRLTLVHRASEPPGLSLFAACPRVTLPTCPLAAPPRSPLHFCTRLRRSCTFALPFICAPRRLSGLRFPFEPFFPSGQLALCSTGQLTLSLRPSCPPALES
jgi:hypothetical protein